MGGGYREKTELQAVCAQMRCVMVANDYFCAGCSLDSHFGDVLYNRLR